MKAAHANKSKIVVTSSLAAVTGDDLPEGGMYLPTTWSNPDKQSGYMKSKTLAEKAAWDYVAALSEGEKFPLVTICPGFIVGPNLNKATFTSGDMIKGMISKEPAENGMALAIIDVRDCAQAHLEAAKRD
jgi:nucleoside-diphosphate-sugar epimerase